MKTEHERFAWIGSPFGETGLLCASGVILFWDIGILNAGPE